MPSATTATLHRPILERVTPTATGFRFRFEYGDRALLLDTDTKGRELDVHVETPLSIGWPSPFVRRAALEQVRRVLLVRSLPNG